MSSKGYVHTGWLTKKGSSVKNWKKRYFTLDAESLIYSTAPSGTRKGIISMLTYYILHSTYSDCFFFLFYNRYTRCH